MKILLVQLSWLGDSVLSTALLEPIKRLYPQAAVDVLTTPAANDIFAPLPLVRQVLHYDKRGAHSGIFGIVKLSRTLKQQRYDLVLSLHRSARTALLLRLAGISRRVGFVGSSLAWCYTQLQPRPAFEHEVLRNLALLGAQGATLLGARSATELGARSATELGARSATELGARSATEGLPELQLVAPSISELRANLAQLVASAPVVLFPCSAWATKRWQGAGFRVVAQHYIALGQQVVILGAPQERAYNAYLMDGLAVKDLTGQTSLSQTFALVQAAQLVVCNDSFGLHVASAFKRPTVVIFCATSPQFGFGPWGNPWAEVVEVSDLHCKPCRRHGSTRCPTGTNLCMTGVSAEQVLAAADRVVQGFTRAKATDF